jgi:hypothetical protein
LHPRWQSFSAADDADSFGCGQAAMGNNPATFSFSDKVFSHGLNGFNGWAHLKGDLLRPSVESVQSVAKKVWLRQQSR